MKRLFLFIAIMLMGVLTFAQDTFTVSANSEDISQSLDLKIVAKLFAEAETVEQFETLLNNPDSAFSNLDLNGDGQIDYLRVVETGVSNNRLIVIQAVLAKDIFQDVASIYVEKNEKNEVTVQVIGDEYVYGTNYIIEPVYVYRPVIYTYLWNPYWRPWYSPWYWNYYPHWWHHRHCYTYNWYWDRCHRFHHHHHYCSFHHGHQPHHGYHTMHSGVSRREYSVAHPDNSFSRRTGHTNARDINRGNVTPRSPIVREQNRSVVSRTYDSRNINSSRTSTQRTSDNTQRQSGVSNRHTPTQSSSTRTQTTRSTNTTRTTAPTQTRTTTTRQSSSVQSTQRTTPVRTSGTPTRTSSSNAGTRVNSGSRGPVRTGGSTPRPSGGSRGSVRR